MQGDSSKRLKILLIGFCPPEGVIADLMIELAGALNKRVTLDLLVPRNLPVPEGSFRKNYTLNYSKSKPLSVFTPESARIMREIRKNDYDVALFYTQHILNAPISIILKKPLQVMWWHEPVRSSRQAILNNIVYYGSDMVLTRRSKMIIIGCEKMISTIPVHLRGKLKAVPLPFIDAFASEGDILPLEHSPADIVFFGSIFAYKGLDVLAEALEILRKRDSSTLKLLVVGKGDLASICPRLLALSYVYPDQIEFRNRYESHKAVSSAIAACKLLVLPYLSGTASATVQTAYRQSKPVIASDVGCFSEYVIHGETGILIPAGDANALADAIDKMCTNEKEAERMGNNGYRLLQEKYTLDTVSDKMIGLFTEMCTNGVG